MGRLALSLLLIALAAAPARAWVPQLTAAEAGVNPGWYIMRQEKKTEAVDFFAGPYDDRRDCELYMPEGTDRYGYYCAQFA